jgi:hypothetical protein
MHMTAKRVVLGILGLLAAYVAWEISLGPDQ